MSPRPAVPSWPLCSPFGGPLARAAFQLQRTQHDVVLDSFYCLLSTFVSYSEQDAASEKNLSVVQATCKAQKSQEQRRRPSRAARVKTYEAVSCTVAKFSEKRRTLVKT